MFCFRFVLVAHEIDSGVDFFSKKDVNCNLLNEYYLLNDCRQVSVHVFCIQLQDNLLLK